MPPSLIFIDSQNVEERVALQSYSNFVTSSALFGRPYFSQGNPPCLILALLLYNTIL